MIIEKKTFSITDYEFEAGVRLPVQIGYETYGTLNTDRSNAILICHYFSGNSHAAGRYVNEPENAAPGWWDSLIGPGKAFDTEEYFIICSDVLCNASPYNPHVITTGPTSKDPITGEKYGMTFPEVTIRDFVKLQHELIQSLGIHKLYCVAGPSMGGMQAIQWAVDFPNSIKKVVSVISTGRTSAYTGVIPLQIGIDAIRTSTDEGLRLAIKLMTMQNKSFHAYSKLWGHPTPSHGPNPKWNGNVQSHTYLQELNDQIEIRIPEVDAEHWLYLSRATQLFNLAVGYQSYDEALSRVQADVLAISVTSDLLFPPQESRDMIERLQKLSKNARYYEVQTDGGHLTAILEPEKFVDPIKQFLNS